MTETGSGKQIANTNRQGSRSGQIIGFGLKVISTGVQMALKSPVGMGE
jgi:hypothetical protein